MPFLHSIARMPFALAGAALALASVPAAAPPPAPEAGLTLDGLVETVVRQHPEVLFHERALAGLRAGPGSKEAEVNAVAAWSSEAGQPFAWPGRLALRKALANRDRTLAELGVARHRSALAGRVRTLALAMTAAAAEADITRQVAERLQAVRAVLQERVPAGVAPTLEMRLLEGAGMTLRQAAGEAEQACREARVELNRLRGEPPETALQVKPLPPSTWPACPSWDRLRAAAETNHFEWRVRLDELARQGFRLEGTRLTWAAPSLQDGVQPLNRAAQSAAPGTREALTLRLQQANTSLQTARREMEESLARAAHAYAARLATLDRWGADGLGQLQATAEMAERSYRSGAIPVATYVEAQRQWADSAAALLATRQKLAEAALQLEELTGLTLPPQPLPSPAQP